ncbi:hypothetical protein GCM10022409_01260 [Hymenobacter glaciei]|uniref:DUF2339 domain-containing protein n=1 Tax=Hymenobacter glaciei TaxID=877209 RepID=A0ABP7T7C1_9BACT
MTDFLTTWGSTPLAILKWVLLGLLLTSSRIWNNSRLATGMFLGLLLVGLGFLFKVEHWTGGDAFIIGGPLVVMLTYGLWFRAKSQPELLDYLKLAWVLAAMSTVETTSLFRPLIKPLAGIAEALFWAVALLYVYQRWIHRPVPESE